MSHRHKDAIHIIRSNAAQSDDTATRWAATAG